MDNNNVGLWLQAFGGLCHIAAGVALWFLPYWIDVASAVVWFTATAYLLTKAGQHYEA